MDNKKSLTGIEKFAYGIGAVFFLLYFPAKHLIASADAKDRSAAFGIFRDSLTKA